MMTMMTTTRHTQEHLDKAISLMESKFKHERVSEFGIVRKDLTFDFRSGPCHAGFRRLKDFGESVLYFTCFKIRNEKTDLWHEYLCTESIFAPYIIYHDLDHGLVMSTSLPARLMHLVNYLSRYSAETMFAVEAFYDLVIKHNVHKGLALWLAVTSHLKTKESTYPIGSACSSHTLCTAVPLEVVIDNMVTGDFIKNIFNTPDDSSPYYKDPNYTGCSLLLSLRSHVSSESWWTKINLDKVKKEVKQGKDKKIEAVSPIVDPFKRVQTVGSSGIPTNPQFWDEYLPCLLTYIEIKYPHIKVRTEQR